MNTRVLLACGVVWALGGEGVRAELPANLDESRVPAYTLADPLLAEDGTRVEDPETWRTRRRAELLEVFAREMYGRTPPERRAPDAEAVSVDANALGGRAVRKQVTLWFTDQPDGPKMTVLIYHPLATAGATARWPVFLGLNFSGNHTVHADPDIALPTAWVPKARGSDATEHRASEAARGAAAASWPVEMILERGYALATVYCGELCPDHPAGLADPASVPAMLSVSPGVEQRPADAWGAVGAWAWGLSRAMDYLQTDVELDAGRVAVIGHSRLGKAALWAAAQDERFALVVSNESGCGGAALNQRIYGETVALINRRFPHWFAKNFRAYDDNEAALRFDQHELLALIAPRPLYVASAEGDQWADPRGEFLALKAAEPVYRLFGDSGLPADDLPAVDTPVAGERLAYHLRRGKHAITTYDWEQYLAFADRVWRKTED